MPNLQKYLLIIVLCLTAGCIGARFGSGFSMMDKNYFIEPPHIFLSKEGYVLRWRYGTMGFFFEPSSKVVNGQLLFALQATSSSGALSGKMGQLVITGPKRINALETGGAFWLEPDGRKIPLSIERP